MPRSWTHRLEDILDAFAAIDEYVSACTLSEFASDRRTIQAVAFNFVVIGEAAGQVPDEVRARAAHIPWERMRGMRNLIAHQYFDVDAAILWHTATADLPPLVPALRQLQSSQDGE